MKTFRVYYVVTEVKSVLVDAVTVHEAYDRVFRGKTELDPKCLTTVISSTRLIATAREEE